MKKLMMVAMTLIVACGLTFAEKSDVKKNNKQDEKILKQAKKDAKKYIKEGWKVNPEALPIEKQLDKSYLMQYEYDESMFPKYIMGGARSVDENYDVAKVLANFLAINNLAEQIQTEVTALIENTVGSEQLTAEDAAFITETVMANKQLIAQFLEWTIPVMEMYRINNQKNYEVFVRIAYDAKMAKEVVKRAVREELEKKGNELQQRLDKLLGW